MEVTTVTRLDATKRGERPRNLEDSRERTVMSCHGLPPQRRDPPNRRRGPHHQLNQPLERPPVSPERSTPGTPAAAASSRRTTAAAPKMQIASWVNPARLQRGGKLKGEPVGVLERQDRDTKRWQLGDVAVLHTTLLERLHCRLQLSPPGHAETQMIKATAEGVEAVWPAQHPPDATPATGHH